jgi:dephospho-CoA kinase
MNIIVTGNIGCGKSTFTQMLVAALPTYQVFDVDAEIHKLYDAPSFQKRLTERFGTFDRKMVSDIVFGQASQLAWLERLTRDLLYRPITEAIRHGRTIFDFPLYYEEGMIPQFEMHPSIAVAVYCSTETQEARIMERGRFTPEKMKAIIGQQFSHSLKAALADYSVSTDGTLEDMERHAKAIARKAKIQQLETRFKYLMPSDEAWHKLRRQYHLPSRFYHGIDHLIHMFEQYDRVEHLIQNRRSVQLAIFYHDYVYDSGIGYKSNEIHSAQALWKDIVAHAPQQANVGIKHAQIACEMILATQGHKVTSPYLLNNPQLLSDTEHFLDIDLSGLGTATIKEALATDDDIRREFKQFSDRQFAEGRVLAMSSFLNRPQLFQTETFKQYEEQAKVNLGHIIDRYKTTLAQ